MRKTSTQCTLVILAIFLFSTYALADSFTFTWNSGSNPDSRPVIVGKNKNGPPDHAPAHGYRSKHVYRYYPSSCVYHDADRGLYFYLSGSNWQVAASLPHDLSVRLGSFVSMEMETDKPYIHYDQHKKQYPPGQMKKKGNKKGKK